MSKRDPSKERLLELFEYKDGKLYNKTNRRGTARKGIESGYKDISTGYRRGWVNGKLHKTHRLIWIMHRGDIPENRFPDHKNGIKDDNRIENLRLVTKQENAFNTSAKGYSWVESRNKYRSRIMVDGVLKHLGYFVKEEDAAQSYQVAKEIYHIIEKR
jgi:hypothetical protein